MDYSTILDITWFFSGLILVMVLLNIFQSDGKAHQREILSESHKFLTGEISPAGRMSKFLKMYLDVTDRILLNEKANTSIRSVMTRSGRIDTWKQNLNAKTAVKRMRAALYLGHFGTAAEALALSERLETESSRIVIIYLIYALSRLRFAPSLPIILEKAIRATAEDQLRIAGLCQNFGPDFTRLLGRRVENAKKSEIPFYLTAARFNLSLELTLLLTEQAKTGVWPMRRDAAQILLEKAPHILRKKSFLDHTDHDIRALAYQALASQPTKENLTLLHASLTDTEARESAIIACSTLLRKKPEFLPESIALFMKTPDEEMKKSLARVLAFRLELFLQNLANEKGGIYKELVTSILRQGEFSTFIEFLNATKDPDLLSTLLDLTQALIPELPGFDRELQHYLNEDLLKRIGLKRPELIPEKRNLKKEQITFRLLLGGLLIAFLTFPLIFTVLHLGLIRDHHWLQFIKTFIVQFNYLMVYYSGTLNGIYILITIFSIFGIRKQLRHWSLKTAHFLSRPGMLPSITIIAPAFNEEATIIESSNSLLNLKYSNYDLVIVNDGSRDSTLNTLIRHYDLHKIDLKLRETIKTRNVRGFYANPGHPRLLVIDKVNGGKADSLNVGINISNADYVCGIDADSLLEPEALTKIAANILDSEIECVAAGGNILPVNGCSVSRGHLDRIGIPRNPIAQFQTTEYLRAFLTSRVGWADMNSLLVISGAFGVFKRRRLIEIGGYLTSSGKFQKDTVGEDMELVVRLVRHMHRYGRAHKVQYSVLANCWTEVPESLKILYRQRDRWQRGLLDILTFHRKMIFNPYFKEAGMIAFPYFILFEGIGPLIELQGYIMVILAAIFGLLNGKIALLLFIAAIMMGMVNSLLALYASGLQRPLFSLRDKLRLSIMAIIENIGYRQLQLYIRVAGYINSLKRPKGWGTMVRKGIGAS